MTRRDVLGAATGLAALAAEPTRLRAVTRGTDIESRRPPPSERKFTSRRVEEAIARIKPLIGDPELAWMFENCLPNTLDTTVFLSQQDDPTRCTRSWFAWANSLFGELILWLAQRKPALLRNI